MFVGKCGRLWGTFGNEKCCYRYVWDNVGKCDQKSVEEGKKDRMGETWEVNEAREAKEI